MNNNTFNHELALQGAPVWCGQYLVTPMYEPYLKLWFVHEQGWNINGSPLGDYPPLSTVNPKTKDDNI